MSEAVSCALEGTCLATSARMPLQEVLARLEREALWSTCDTGRYRVPYYSWGNGPPLLLIPGIADDARSFAQLAVHLAQHLRCIAYDLPAGGKDGARLAAYRHDDLVADAFALLDHLQVAQAYVLGSSFGGSIALAAMRARPERLPRAILQGAFAWRPLAPAELLLARMARSWPGSLRWLPFRRTVLRHNHYAPFAALPPEVWDYFLTRSNCLPMAALAHRAVMLHGLDLRPLLTDIRQPVLVVSGDADPLVGPSCTETLLAGLPQARQIMVSNCGHNPLFTHPELFAEIVRQFLTPPG
jgi:pimeloyl-ACP methyl ester carboxylesterase